MSQEQPNADSLDILCVPNLESQIGNDFVLEDSILHANTQNYELNLFLEKKYSQLGNLQQYLLSELQEIQDCRYRNIKIKQSILKVVIPTLQDMRKILLILKQIPQRYLTYSIDCIGQISSKSESLLKQKDQQIQEKQRELQNYQINIKKIEQKLKPSLSWFKLNEFMFRPSVVNEKPQTTQIRLVEQAKKLISSQFQLGKNKQNSPHPSNKYDLSSLKKYGFEESSVSHKISPLKIKDHEQTYKKIIQGKSLNISYKCSKSPHFQNEKSPLKSNQIIIETGDRKSLIKQKIEKIKGKCVFSKDI